MNEWEENKGEEQGETDGKNDKSATESAVVRHGIIADDFSKHIKATRTLVTICLGKKRFLSIWQCVKFIHKINSCQHPIW